MNARTTLLALSTALILTTGTWVAPLSSARSSLAQEGNVTFELGTPVASFPRGIISR